MARGRTILTCLMWLLLVFSITLCASATAGARLGTSQQVVYPQGTYIYSILMVSVLLFRWETFHASMWQSMLR
ncbi:hypothetical protein Gotur_021890 [Gossypium turneri]